jgi:hypothetical protein
MPRAVKVVTEQGTEVPQPVDLDLDALESEATHRPFRFQLGGETFVMHSPDDVDWQVQASLDADDAESLKAFIRELLGGDEETFQRFCAHKLATRKLRKLTSDCYAHYATTPPESPASPSSSKPTARR